MGVGLIGDVEVGYIEAAAFDTLLLDLSEVAGDKAPL
ncbi:hypothetical protein FOQG_12672 [Fusarium oxysporum f. sp. raphani 54005]|uniref:Uncharacterized protein n=2 Tax=Fusarium oxysporum TaxID=5507 RepID=X0BVN2_FUSOX|nr:hypothetical protein FOVG_13571 [Fusarium oxysporum f. sp. pisi HDV247]EXK82978.1 hypothetical protein FOQG_12672 [Fusarium oxysporum f. sp. raphani 54005]